ncbi:RNA polymerase sigma-70 factor (sigma-E family) [Kribbella sp. VKM Ac-2568]|nr:RNA polymerase sigma-70 factor (sigma-E family) [Kribbella sp. VKM Ac-2568]
MLGARITATDGPGRGLGDKEKKISALSPGWWFRSSVKVMGAMDAAAELPSAGVRRDADALVVALFQAEGARLVQLARWFVDDRTAAEDLVQEAFLRLARNQHRINDPDRAAAYLRSIVINLARDHNRRGLVSLRHRPPAEVDDRSAEDHVADGESRREVIEALRGLPRRQRDCVVLRYYVELPVAEIAATLGLSPNSVKTHLRRGLRSLKAELEEPR